MCVSSLLEMMVVVTLGWVNVGVKGQYLSVFRFIREVNGVENSHYMHHFVTTSKRRAAAVFPS